eukprot:TRINITY_DN5064_c0_g1_i10.p1 TRINITY_DN5064_c0_g1~~TRINITY_DN5064_c0_g1_i10.p1  ORF type:complete len:215 (+),score=-17.11 TRINITY_DN5064_c0_g1_i10:521-1165(+)
MDFVYPKKICVGKHWKRKVMDQNNIHLIPRSRRQDPVHLYEYLTLIIFRQQITICKQKQNISQNLGTQTPKIKENQRTLQQKTILLYQYFQNNPKKKQRKLYLNNNSQKYTNIQFSQLLKTPHIRCILFQSITFLFQCFPTQIFFGYTKSIASITKSKFSASTKYAQQYYELIFQYFFVDVNNTKKQHLNSGVFQAKKRFITKQSLKQFQLQQN